MPIQIFGMVCQNGQDTKHLQSDQEHSVPEAEVLESEIAWSKTFAHVSNIAPM